MSFIGDFLTGRGCAAKQTPSSWAVVAGVRWRLGAGEGGGDEDRLVELGGDPDLWVDRAHPYPFGHFGHRLDVPLPDVAGLECRLERSVGRPELGSIGPYDPIDRVPGCGVRDLHGEFDGLPDG